MSRENHESEEEQSYRGGKIENMKVDEKQETEKIRQQYDESVSSSLVGGER